MAKHTIYKKHEIIVERDPDVLNWWYIQVIAPDGCYTYDGWWKYSEDKTEAEAIREAKIGASLITPTEPLNRR